MRCDICGKKADKFYNFEGDKACSECVKKWEEQQDVCPSYMGHLQCAEAEDYKNLETENKRLRNALEEISKSPQWRHVPNWVVIKCEQALKDTK